MRLHVRTQSAVSAAAHDEIQRWIAVARLGPGTVTPRSTDVISDVEDSDQEHEEEIDRTLRTAEESKATLRYVSHTIHRFSNRLMSKEFWENARHQFLPFVHPTETMILPKLWLPEESVEVNGYLICRSLRVQLWCHQVYHT